MRVCVFVHTVCACNMREGIHDLDNSINELLLNLP